MPDLKNHTVTLTANKAQVGPTALSTVLEYTVSGEVVDSGSGANLAAYSFTWPNVLTTLTADQYAAIMQSVFRQIITAQTGF